MRIINRGLSTSITVRCEPRNDNDSVSLQTFDMTKSMSPFCTAVAVTESCAHPRRWLDHCVIDDIAIVRERTACCIVRRRTGIISLTTTNRSAARVRGKGRGSIIYNPASLYSFISVIISVRLSREYKPPIVLLTIADGSPHFNVVSILYIYI